MTPFCATGDWISAISADYFFVYGGRAYCAGKNGNGRYSDWNFVGLFWDCLFIKTFLGILNSGFHCFRLLVDLNLFNVDSVLNQKYERHTFFAFTSKFFGYVKWERITPCIDFFSKQKVNPKSKMLDNTIDCSFLSAEFKFIVPRFEKKPPSIFFFWIFFVLV